MAQRRNTMQESDTDLPWLESLCLRISGLTVLDHHLFLYYALQVYTRCYGCVLKAKGMYKRRSACSGRGLAQVLAITPSPLFFMGVKAGGRNSEAVRYIGRGIMVQMQRIMRRAIGE